MSRVGNLVFSVPSSCSLSFDSRLRCGVADLYYVMYGRTRPSCLPIPEVECSFFFTFLGGQGFLRGARMGRGGRVCLFVEVG